MPVAKTHTAQAAVTGGQLVTVESDVTRGLHSFTIVGLPGKAVEEARDRVSAAIKNSGFPSPKSQNHKITISLAPADLKKDGPLFDLPIAIAYLAATEVVKPSAEQPPLLVGELALDGSLQPVRGILSVVKTAQNKGFTSVIVPSANAKEAALVADITVFPARSLKDAVSHLASTAAAPSPLKAQPLTHIEANQAGGNVALEDIRGQAAAKRGLLIAAAGRHNVLMVGPPGTGKTMLARAFQNILPPLTREEALEVTDIHSIAGTFSGTVSTQPPFRSPHHTASHTSLVGGGTHPKPGEITLAHKGVLFVDEFPEFERRSIDALRQPLEDRVVTIARVQGTHEFPADFILLAAMNPYRGSEDGTTNLAAAMLETYKGKISGPILDRIDLWLEVPHVDYDTLTDTTKPKTDETKQAREHITTARARMLARAKTHNLSATTNDALTARDLEAVIKLSDDVKDILKTAAEKLNLSPRSYHRIIKVARTIADLDDKENIQGSHVLEALQYRVKL